MLNKYFFYNKNIEIKWMIIFPVLLLLSISLITLYSTKSSISLIESNFFKQCVFVLFGFIIFYVLQYVRNVFFYEMAYVFYFILLTLLIITLFMPSKFGASRWIFIGPIRFQPSEFGKIIIVFTLSKFLADYKNNINDWKLIPLTLPISSFPAILIFKQPDLGTSVLIAVSGIAVLWFAGINHKYFIYTMLGFVISLPFVIAFLKPYQKLRVLTFLNPDKDPLGAGYQIIQSKIAVGSGGIFGKGFLKGTQSYLEFLPEKHTDFIFTLFSEEFGFVGSVVLLVIYIIIIYRIVAIGANSRSYFAKLFCYGFGAAIFVFITINMSMVLGLLPIVGSPLPIMSYGGSSMLATMIGFGIVMSAKVHNQQLIA